MEMDNERPSLERPACWICLEHGIPDQPLQTPCNCLSRPVHIKCLAREENVCRFCNCPLPDWRSSLTPPQVKPVRPVMAIKFDGKTYKLRVQPGPEGLQLFKEQVRQLLGFDINEEFDVSFECQVPSTGEKLSLTGLSSYGAATHCAAVVAAERKAFPAHSSTPTAAQPERVRSPMASSRPPSTSADMTGSPGPSSPRANTTQPESPSISSPAHHRHAVSRLAATAIVPAEDQQGTHVPTTPANHFHTAFYEHQPTTTSHCRSRSVTMDHNSQANTPSSAHAASHLTHPRRSSDAGTPQSSLSRALAHGETSHHVMLPPICPASPGSVASSNGLSFVNLSSTSSTISSVASSSPVASTTVKLPLFSKASMLARQTMRRLLGSD